MLRQSLLVTGFMTGPPALVERNLEHFNALTRRTRAVRRLGSAALDLAYVASGRFDAYWHLALNAWDWAAGALLVQEAGGRVTTLDQGLLQPGESSSILACNVQLYPRLQAALHPQWMIEDDEAGR
jgi:myo-inositol-1(or 4)-monophosphatase